MPLDTALTLWFNAMGSEALDPWVQALTLAQTWVPLYLLLLLLIGRQGGWRVTLYALLGIGLAVLLADGMSSGICKPLFCRLRPTHDPALEGLVRIVGGYRGGPYGFFSSHAANTSAIATFCILLLRRRWVAVVMVLYVLINCWTRLYMAAHYVSDILVGLLWGIFVGVLSFRLTAKLFGVMKS